jgi:hypothetical protein
MTITTTTRRKVYSANGATTVLAYDFKILASAHLEVYVDVGAGLVLQVGGYTVDGVGVAGGGNVTFSVAPASGTNNVLLLRNVPLTQESDYVENDNFPAETHEQALDKLTMLVQQAFDLFNRSLTQPDGDAVNIARLPAKAARASKYIAFDANGDPVATAGTTSVLVVSTFIETLLDDVDALTARETLDAMQDVFTTRGDLVRAGASGVEERVPLGTARQLLQSDGTDAVWGALKGTITNNSAAAGEVGEYVSATVASGSAVSLTTNVAADVTSISLTAGDWDVSGTVGFNGGGGTSVTNLTGSISTTTATVGGNGKQVSFVTAANVINTAGAGSPFLTTPRVRISIAATTTVYLVAYGLFSVSTLSAYGEITARRVR